MDKTHSGTFNQALLYQSKRIEVVHYRRVGMETARVAGENSLPWSVRVGAIYAIENP
jgi:hypothetical protein